MNCYNYINQLERWGHIPIEERELGLDGLKLMKQSSILSSARWPKKRRKWDLKSLNHENAGYIGLQKCRLHMVAKHRRNTTYRARCPISERAEQLRY
jgi:hypothetical protein